MITATLTAHDGEIFHTWTGNTLYDIVMELNAFLAETGVRIRVTPDVVSLKKQVAALLDDAILVLDSDGAELLL
jgi:hypothetical protein